jgi:magnesium transporter
MPPSPPPGSSSWATFIGIVICLCGNIIISFALNIQRLAHERLQSSSTHVAAPPSTEEQVPVLERPVSYGTVLLKRDEEDESRGYLRSPLWWTGLVLMCLGETGNFVACNRSLAATTKFVDGFAPASIVAPLGTVAILCNALIAPLVFHEKFRKRDFLGIVLATAGAVTVVLSAETQEEKVPSY